MVTIVAVSVNGGVVRVQCDGMSRDSVLSKNVVLVGCRELDTEAHDGSALDTKLWSVPEVAILSYAVGTLPVVAPVVPVIENVDPTANMTPEELKAHHDRRKRIDDEARKRRDAERRARAKAKKSSTAPVVEQSDEVSTSPATQPVFADLREDPSVPAASQTSQRRAKKRQS